MFDGNVLVTHQALVQSETSFSIEASGNLTVEMGSTLQAKGPDVPKLRGPQSHSRSVKVTKVAKPETRP